MHVGAQAEYNESILNFHSVALDSHSHQFEGFGKTA